MRGSSIYMTSVNVRKFKRYYNLRNRIAGGNPDQTASSLYLPER